MSLASCLPDHRLNLQFFDGNRIHHLQYGKMLDKKQANDNDRCVTEIRNKRERCGETNVDITVTR